ncbi:hypothetical protein Q6350_09460 [Isoptericola sp. b515]|uniref:PH-like domain-containing protein n=1 Tax=Isoptericola sp. b515 TaxID=3064652 RepID=UPI00271230B6|nr:hypothetical protein [Isoptericola sp. b515]MDO8148660.1 hypothetical protein [Isoptericola sp. b515]
MNLPLPVAVGIWVVVGLVLLLLVLTGRRRLATRTRHLVPSPPEPPLTEGELGEMVVGPVEAVYVSSTLHGDWLARIGAHGLGDRSHAEVTVYAGGVVVDRDAARPLLLPADALRAAGTAPGMAGKYVGRDGLVVLTWQVPADGTVEATTVDTGLRTRHRADHDRLLAAVRPLISPSTPSPKDPQ